MSKKEKKEKKKNKQKDIINKSILNYVDAFFEKIPYSKECYIAKEKITETLNSEYEKSQDFEKITEKFNTLESIAVLAGYSKKDVNHWKSSEKLLEIDDVKVGFKKERKHITFATIFSVLIFGSIVNLFTIGIHNIISVIFWTILLILNLKKYKKIIILNSKVVL